MTHRKHPRGWLLCLLLTILSGCSLLVQLGLKLLTRVLLHQAGSASVGIIGGADGPTAIFVTSTAGSWFSELLSLLLSLLVLLLGLFGLRRFRRHS